MADECRLYRERCRITLRPHMIPADVCGTGISTDSETDAGADFAGVELQFAATGNRPAFVRDEPFVIFPKG